MYEEPMEQGSLIVLLALNRLKLTKNSRPLQLKRIVQWMCRVRNLLPHVLSFWQQFSITSRTRFLVWLKDTENIPFYLPIALVGESVTSRPEITSFYFRSWYFYPSSQVIVL